jgi:hypothetical protein
MTITPDQTLLVERQPEKFGLTRNVGGDVSRRRK